MLNAVVKESQFRLVFIVPDVAVSYRYPPHPPSPIAVGFCTVPFGSMSADFQETRVVNLWQIIVRSLMAENMGSWGES